MDHSKLEACPDEKEYREKPKDSKGLLSWYTIAEGSNIVPKSFTLSSHDILFHNFLYLLLCLQNSNSDLQDNIVSHQKFLNIAK